MENRYQIEYTIEYVFGSYSGKHKVTLDSEDSRDPCDVMWGEFRRKGYLTLSMAAQAAKVIDRQIILARYPADYEY